MQEETGIYIKISKLKYTVVSEVHQTIYHCYLAHVEVEEDSVRLQPGETMGYEWIEKSRIDSFLESDLHVPGRHSRVLKVIEKMST